MYMLSKKKKLILPLFLTLLISLKTYSQKAIVTETGDTSICFSVEQSKFILKKINSGKLCDTLLSVCENQLRLSDSVSKSNEKIISILNQKFETEKQLTDLCNSKIDVLEWQIENYKKDIKKQKSQKIAGILAGIVTTSFMTYMYIKK